MYDESDDQTGTFQRLTYPAFAPEADIVSTGERSIWFVMICCRFLILLQQQGLRLELASLDRRFLPRCGVITVPNKVVP